MRGINVHAKQVVDGRDRRQLERLCRYITRPPVAQERLERLCVAFGYLPAAAGVIDEASTFAHAHLAGLGRTLE